MHPAEDRIAIDMEMGRQAINRPALPPEALQVLALTHGQRCIWMESYRILAQSMPMISC